MADFTKAIYVQKKVAGANKWRRADVDLVSQGGTTALKPRGHTPGRARVWDTADGEVYDDVLFFDTWPDQWPTIGNVHG